MASYRNRLRMLFRDHSPARLTAPSLVDSAVLVILMDLDHEPTLILTERASTLSNHAGEVSFPGGVVAKTDASRLDTALRETYEELGLTRDQLRIYGRLDEYATLTGFKITPYAAVLDDAPAYRINRAEVARVLEIPLAVFVSLDHASVEALSYHGQSKTVYFFHYDDVIVWGATAWIAHQFASLVHGSDPLAELARHAHGSDI